MVTQFGMSETLGNIDYMNEQQSYLGPAGSGVQAGPETQEKIDAEVRKIVDEGYNSAKTILIENKDKLEFLAKGLLEYETLTGVEIEKVMNGGTLNRDTEDDDSSSGDASSITAVPKSGKKPPKRDGGLRPQTSS